MEEDKTTYLIIIDDPRYDDERSDSGIYESTEKEEAVQFARAKMLSWKYVEGKPDPLCVVVETTDKEAFYARLT